MKQSFFGKQAKEFRRIAADWKLLAGLLIVSLFLLIAIIYPLLEIFGEFASQGIKQVGAFLLSRVNQTIIKNTLVLGTLVGLIGTALGFLFAYVQTRVDVPCKKLFHFMALLPVVSPPFAVATSAIVLFGRSGILTYKLFGFRYDIYGLDGLTFVLALSFFPVAYMNLLGMMQALDPALDEAATNLGASHWKIFKTITLPMLVPGIASSFLLLFVEAIADLANPLVMGGDFTVLASRIYIAIIGEYNLTNGAILSVLLLLPSLTVFILQRYWGNRKSVISVTGKPSGKPRMIKNPFARWTLFALVLIISLLIFTIYGTVVLGAFTNLFGIDNTFTLEHFKFVLFGYGSKAIVDTSWLALVATPIAGLLAILIAWLVVRKQFAGRSLLDFTSMLGIAVPGTVLGIGYVLAFRSATEIGGVSILPSLAGGSAFGSGAIAIILAFIVRSIPAGVRAGASSLQQIDPSIEEASLSLGADNGTTFRKITLPLIRPATLTSLVYSFARSMTSLSAIVFLTTPGTKIMTAQILNEVDAGRFGNAFAYCVILIFIVLVVIGGLSRLVGKSHLSSDIEYRTLS